MLDSLLESLPTARLFLLVNYRPEYQHGWGSKTYYTQLRLDPLPPESAAAWEHKGQFIEEGHLVMEGPLREILWLLLFDAVHHRGQLSTYIRPMGGRVPSIYGPSADESGG